MRVSWSYIIFIPQTMILLRQKCETSILWISRALMSSTTSCKMLWANTIMFRTALRADARVFGLLIGLIIIFVIVRRGMNAKAGINRSKRLIEASMGKISDASSYLFQWKRQILFVWFLDPTMYGWGNWHTFALVCNLFLNLILVTLPFLILASSCTFFFL